MSKFSAILLGILVLLAMGLATFAEATVQYDPILEWTGPHFRAINAPTINQLVNDPATDFPFLQPFAVAAREHAAAGRDVIYVADAGNNRIQAFEANATYIITDQSSFTWTSPVAAASQWDADQIYLSQWAAGGGYWLVPFSEVLTVDGDTWTWVASLAGFTATDQVYTIDYDDATNAPEIQLPSNSLASSSTFTLRYLVSNDQTGATAAYGLGDVDYGTGNGATPVLTEIDESTGGSSPTSWQQVRSLAVIQNEVTATSDDLFVLDAADASTNQDEELWFVTIPLAGTISAGEKYDDVLTTPYDVAVARSGSSTGAAVAIVDDAGPFDKATAAVSDASQVTGHVYMVSVAAGAVTITDSTTSKVLVTSGTFANLANPCLAIPGLSLPLNGAVGVSTSIHTTRNVSNRYLFVADTGADRIKVVGASDGSGTGWAGDWLPSDAHTADDQPAAAGLIGAVADRDFSLTSPATVPENWQIWSNAFPVKEGSLESITFDPDGASPATWTRVEDITAAGPADEVFELDWTLGLITFGDGIHGEIPPASTEYQFTYSTSVDVMRYGSSGTGAGRFSGPRGIAARYNTNIGAYDVYVADTGNNRIQKFAFYQEDAALNIPARMVYQTSWNTASSSSDYLNNPVDVIVGVDGSSDVWVAVADQGNDRIVIYEDTAAEGAGGATAPTFDVELGSQGNTLGRYAQLSGIAFLTNGNDLDIYATDGQRNVVQKYEEAPTPTITLTFTGASDLPTCFPPTGSYTFSFTVTNAPLGGWVDFYYDTASSFDSDTAHLCIESGTVEATASSATWSLSDTPGGAPADGDSYYLYARVKDASGNTVAYDQTDATELFCVDSSLLASLKAVDALDNDKCLYLQNSLERVIELTVAYPDSVIAVGYKGTFDTTLLEVVGITEGNAWDGTGAVSTVFTSNYNNTTGVFEVNSSGVGSPSGLTGNGPHTIARVLVRAKANAVDTTTRFKNGTFAVVKANSSMTDINGDSPTEWRAASLDVRVAYLGDIATTSAGADSTLPNFRPKPDGLINFADQMIFTLGWNGDGTDQDPISDLGPVTGSAPDLVCVPDQVYDVDDILSFTTMYSWAASNGYTRVAPGQSEFAVRWVDGVRPAPLGEDMAGVARVFTVSHVSNPHPGALLSVDVVAEANSLTGALVTLGFNPDQLRPVEVIPGELLRGQDGHLFFQRAGNDWLEIASSRLDRAHPGVSGTGVLATVTFEILGSTTDDLDVVYDLRSSNGRVLSRGNAKTGPLSGGHASFELYSNYPNPVKGSTSIVFSLPSGANVSLDVYDAGGRLVRNLAKGAMNSGYHAVNFDGRSADGNTLAAGVYFYQLRAGDQLSTRKLIIAR